MKSTQYKENPLKYKYGHHAHQKQPKEIQINKLKKEIRDAERLLKRDIPATKQVELQRKISSLKTLIEQQLQREKQDQLKEKYKYLKFVELKKINRQLKKETNEMQKKELNEMKDYIEFYPVDIKYIALFPHENKDAQQDLKQKIQAKINELRTDGKLIKGFEWRMKGETKVDAIPEKQENDDFFV
jgi:hypothetical protein